MKSRGHVSITFEGLKEKLGLEDNEEIINIFRSSEDMLRDTVSILVSADKPSKHTSCIAEGAKPPTMEVIDK